MKTVLLATLLVTTCLAANIVPTVRVCGARLVELFNAVCLRKEMPFTKSALHSIYDDHLQSLLDTPPQPPTSKLSLVEHCCFKECRLADVADYCDT